MFDGLIRKSLIELERKSSERFALLKQAGLSLDLTRGKPSPEQMALSDPLEAQWSGDYYLADGTDVRNYGGLTGIQKARQLGAELLGVSPSEVIAGGNSSLTLMYQYLLNAWLNGPVGPGTAWRDETGPLKFICLVPGYDRHFTIVENLGFELINVNIEADGPDMSRIEELVTEDPRIKGIWCVPKYSNPTGHVYSDEIVERFAQLGRRAGANFRIMWDNAYAVHDFDEEPPKLTNLMDCCRAAGTADSVVMFTSTSKITRAGAGMSFVAASAANLEAFKAHLSVQTIGPDKINQLRHIQFLKNSAGVRDLMRKHASIVRPKFDRVLHHLQVGLSPHKIATWSTPRGGYFISFNAPLGSATTIVKLAGDAGLKLTPAGATFPGGRDPDDSNIRLAPTYPSLEELDRAMPVFVEAVTLSAVRQQLQS